MDEELDLDATDLSRPFVDFLILADYVESTNGKLYMMGGGWENYTVPDPSRPVRFGVAIAIMVPWGATNERHTLTLRIENADGQAATPTMSAEFQVGRPPALPPGAEQRIVWAFNGDFALPAPSEYRLVAAIDGEDSEWTTFRLLNQQPQSEQQPG